MVKRLHHINFLVKDLDTAIPRYCKLLGMPAPKVEELPRRGVRLVRFKLGETWLILIQPVDLSGVPGRYLAEHGEGFFLASLQVEDLQESVLKMASVDIALIDEEARPGLDDWQVVDVEPDQFNDICFQLVQSADD
jgi:methylmalonyl-CoA/ethylmalonyl-CoA epimerase